MLLCSSQLRQGRRTYKHGKSCFSISSFSRVSETDIENYLKTVHNVSEKQARAAAAFSGGIVKKALELLQDSDFKKTRDEVIDLSMVLRKKDKLYVLSLTDYFIANKDKIDNILDIMMSVYRDMIIYKECGNIKYLINLDKCDDIVRECTMYTIDSLVKIIEVVKTAIQNINYNANYQLAIEMMLLNIQEG
jgi:DNA polymerase-3 subunit delta'